MIPDFMKHEENFPPLRDMHFPDDFRWVMQDHLIG